MKRNILIIIFMLMAVTCFAQTKTAAQTAEEILNKSSIQGGLIVHIGCNDGRLTAALQGDGPFVVQGLEVNRAKVKQARSYIQSEGLYGRVSIILWNGLHLPYAENMVNLIVAEAPGKVTIKEMMRVLTPLGVALVKEKDGWTKHVKPWPDDIDEWAHYLHGPDNNAVANDTVVGPPKHMQWVSGPMYARSHEVNSSLAAMVSSGGRLFYIWDEGIIGLTDKRMQARWSLLARDAFNGTLLWKHRMPNWGWREWHAESRWDNTRLRAKMLRANPASLTRRLVATKKQLYVTLGYEAPISIIDTATGKVSGEIPNTKWVDEILFDKDVLVLRLRVPESPPEKDAWTLMPEQTACVMAIRVDNHKILWKSKPEPMAALSLAVSHGRIFYSTYKEVVCLDRASGKELWRSMPVKSLSGNRASQGTLVAQKEVVLNAYIIKRKFRDQKKKGKKKKENDKKKKAKKYDTIHKLIALSAKTGKLLWEGPDYDGPGVANPPDLFVANNLVWVGDTTLPKNQKLTEVRRQGFDLLTGKVMKEVSVAKLKSPGHHARCYRSKATDRFLMLPKRGVEFLDIQGNDHMRNDWVRPSCIFGVTPANGLLYVPPHQCVCYPGVLLSYFNVLAAKRDLSSQKVMKPKDQTRLTKGPAYGKKGNNKLQIAKPGDWPTYRRDSLRSGFARTMIPDKPKQLWETSLKAPITPPIAASGRVIVAEKDTHKVVALDSAKGRVLWQYTAGGRIDSPPTVYNGLVLFGCADGWAYCLQASDGKEVWRFQAAPEERRIMVSGQLESVWPVHGSVLVLADATAKKARSLAYVTAGRSSYLDGGIHVYGLDPYTGKAIHHTCLDGPHPDPHKDKGNSGYMDGSKSDILVSDGSDIYLFQERFTGDLTRKPAPMQNKQKEKGGHRIYLPSPERDSSGKHLIATGGFLDDTLNEGTYWNYSSRWPGWRRHLSGVPGQLLVFNEQMLFGVNRFTKPVRVRHGFTPGEKGVRLFARKHDKKKDRWSEFIQINIRAMVLAGKDLFVAGAPDVVPDDDPLAAYEGRKGSILMQVSAKDGTIKDRRELKTLPVFDGLIAAENRLFLSTKDGRVLCFGSKK